MLYKFYQQHIFPHLLNQVMQTPALMDLRRELLLPVQGEALEIGFGTGLNLPFYQNVDLIYALEPSTEIYQLALDRVHHNPFQVRHIQAGAEKLPFADNSLDHIVSTWTMCSIADLDQALKEMFRVLKPSGTVHLVEHVLHNENRRIRQLQHLLTPVQKRLADGCHLNRNIEQQMLEHGFVFTEKQYIAAKGIPAPGQLMFLARATKSAVNPV
ncbi:class I SAM-dependent methyltransferase [Acinetobacter chinensis]|uniref:Class I SAM-dependent methyltransferase n=1 Tax=Acinetobacter chinensis TaxID=2004650 RepID=A0ABU3WG43_9GAMM|nr:class I SAM-dependent methyltransferase [Acinetobacter chinensis]MDV2469384.1 class I SAM-dependent methyltransferase [Acinetobacter chinensis]